MKSSSTSITKVIRVLIADDHPVVREGLVTILKSEKDIEVVAEAADGKETSELYNEGCSPSIKGRSQRLPGERADGQQIREAVRKVAAGRALLQPEIASKLAESMARPELSERELQVLQYMALGRSNKEIGQVLYISENTVKGHVKSILTKLDALGRRSYCHRK